MPTSQQNHDRPSPPPCKNANSPTTSPRPLANCSINALPPHQYNPMQSERPCPPIQTNAKPSASKNTSRLDLLLDDPNGSSKSPIHHRPRSSWWLAMPPSYENRRWYYIQRPKARWNQREPKLFRRQMRIFLQYSWLNFKLLWNYNNCFKRVFIFTSACIKAPKSAIFTRFCSIVSRYLTVTSWLAKLSWSTVIQKGVPMASIRR